MLSYHNDPAIKEMFLGRVAAHQAADEIIKGTYWENGKGCAFGCMFHSSDHMLAEKEAGIPVMLAHLQDCIFEGLMNGKAKAWVVDFPAAVPVGKDLSKVGWLFLHWLLTESKIGPYEHPLIRDAVKKCADVLVPLTKGAVVDKEAACSAAYSAADSAARSAYSAAYSAARSAYSAARSAADSPACSAARSAYSAARSAACSAADSPACSAYSAARSATRSAAYEKMAEKLLELLKSA